MARKKTVFQSIREDQLEDPPDRPVRPDREGNREERDALSDLALQMAALPTERRKKLPIDGELAEIVELLNRVLRGSGRKRLIRRAVKLLRVEDVEALQREVSGEGAYDDRLHALERWRTRILEEGDPAIHDFVHQPRAPIGSPCGTWPARPRARAPRRSRPASGSSRPSRPPPPASAGRSSGPDAERRSCVPRRALSAPAPRGPLR